MDTGKCMKFLLADVWIIIRKKRKKLIKKEPELVVATVWLIMSRGEPQNTHMGMDYIAFSTTPASVRSPMGRKSTPNLPFHPRAFVYFNFFIEGSFNSIYPGPDVRLFIPTSFFRASFLLSRRFY